MTASRKNDFAGHKNDSGGCKHDFAGEGKCTCCVAQREPSRRRLDIERYSLGDQELVECHRAHKGAVEGMEQVLAEKQRALREAQMEIDSLRSDADRLTASTQVGQQQLDKVLLQRQCTGLCKIKTLQMQTHVPSPHQPVRWPGAGPGLIGGS